MWSGNIIYPLWIIRSSATWPHSGHTSNKKPKNWQSLGEIGRLTGSSRIQGLSILDAEFPAACFHFPTCCLIIIRWFLQVQASQPLTAALAELRRPRSSRQAPGKGRGVLPGSSCSIAPRGPDRARLAASLPSPFLSWQGPAAGE